MPDPAKRTAINSLVCEGCGDCGVKSNCVAVLPKETEYGRKREIDQSNCNKDFSCVKGFCPSFVTIKGGGLRKRKGTGNKELLANLPEPQFRSNLDQPWNILITGVGGTGVVTIGALLGMAAHLEHKGASVLDQTGLAQKGGAVTTHVRVAAKPSDIHAVRIAAGEADLVLGCDMVVVNDYWALSKIRADRTEVVINDYQAMPGPFTRMPDMQFPAAGIVDAIRTALGGREPLQVPATEVATALLGDAIGSNLFMLGVAWQRGLVPVGFDAIMRAIELNGAAIEMNKTAFAWGRLAAIKPEAVLEAAGLADEPAAVGAASAASAFDDETLSGSLDEMIDRRVKFLTDYQDKAYAGRYVALVDKVRQAEARKAPGSTKLTEAVARYYFKLMAYKDEYEVARLYTASDFRKRIEQQFEGDYKIHFNLAPPLFAKRDADGHLVKKEFGPWMFTAFKLLAKLKGLRGGAFDIFGKTEERRMERQLIVDYAKQVDELLAGLDGDNVDLAIQIASVPEQIRGYGHVKEAHLAKAMGLQKELLARWKAPKAEARDAA